MTKKPKNEVRNIPWQTRLSEKEFKLVEKKKGTRSRADYLVETL